MGNDITYCFDCETIIYEKLDPEGYRHNRCQKHIQQYKEDEAKRLEEAPKLAAEARAHRLAEFLKVPADDRLHDWGVGWRSARAAVTYFLHNGGFLPENLGYTPGQSYYIEGPSGTGKTTLAAAILYHTAHLHLGRIMSVPQLYGYEPDIFRFVSVPWFLDVVRASYRKKDGKEEEANLVEDLSRCGMLVFDDLGMEKSTDWVMTTLDQIIDRRYESEVPTVFTSNIPLDGLAERYGDNRISSRINGWCKVWTRNVADLRSGNGKR